MPQRPCVICRPASGRSCACSRRGGCGRGLRAARGCSRSRGSSSFARAETASPRRCRVEVLQGRSADDGSGENARELKCAGRRGNSKIGVTQAEAGGGPVDSKWVLPNAPSTWENEASRRHDSGRPPSLPFLGAPLSGFLLLPRQGSVQRRATSIAFSCRSTSRRTAKAFIPARCARSRALVASATSAQASTRAKGVQVGHASAPSGCPPALSSPASWWADRS
jgi:hypothetical protein